MLIAQGAEAKLVKEGNVLIKDRVEKRYRIKEIDIVLRKRRTKKEAKLINDAKRAGIKTPTIFDIGDFSIQMEFIEGEKIRDMINIDNCSSLAEKIGKYAALLHSHDIIHGDLTTSNMIIKKDGNKHDLYFIDFGLGFHSSRSEDKANDIYLLRQIMTSTHFSVFGRFWRTFLKVYGENYKGSAHVIQTLEKIEVRGRYKKRN